MRTYDFSPLWRSTIGFDGLFDLAEIAQRAGEDNYPPYNIERLAEDRYHITLAVAGFSPDEISVTAEYNVVTVEGGKAEKAEREYLYRGISARPFKRQFDLADLRACQERSFRQRIAENRVGPGNPRSHEAATEIRDAVRSEQDGFAVHE
jgi:molecular chaperone IbpA